MKNPRLARMATTTASGLVRRFRWVVVAATADASLRSISG